MKSSNRDDGWLTGRLYFNRKDKKVIIKRPQSGFGYTMNLGNKWTWMKNALHIISHGFHRDFTPISHRSSKLSLFQISSFSSGSSYPCCGPKSMLQPNGVSG